MFRRFLVFAASGLLATACDKPVSMSAADPPSIAEAREALLQADYAFADTALELGVEQAYADFLAADAVQLPDGGLTLVGKAAIMENVAAAVASTDFALTWEPVSAEVAASGELGYTWGNYYLEGTDADGLIYAAEGKYANVWRKSSAGRWQVVLDVSNQNEVPYADELEFDFDFGLDEAAPQ